MNNFAAHTVPGSTVPPPLPRDAGAPRPAVVAALRGEARTLRTRAADAPQRFLSEVSGVGLERATRAGRLLVERGATALLSWGTAGALDATVRPGDLMVYGTVNLRDGERFACDAGWVDALAARLTPLSVRVVTGLSSPKAVLDAHERATLHLTTGAAVVDMESAALAQVAAEAGIPFTAVRCVVDPVDFNFPSCALVGLAPDGSSRPGRAVAALARRPYELLDLIRLAGWYRFALKRLALAARHCGPDFAC